MENTPKVQTEVNVSMEVVWQGMARILNCRRRGDRRRFFFDNFLRNRNLSAVRGENFFKQSFISVGQSGKFDSEANRILLVNYFALQ